MVTILYAHSAYRCALRGVLPLLALTFAAMSAARADGALWETALERGEYARAALLRWEGARASPEAGAYEAAARLAYDWSQYTVLARICDDWLTRDAGNEVAHRFRAVAALELDHRAIAETHLEWLIGHAYPSAGEAFESLGRSLAVLQNRSGVAAVMRKLLRRHEDVGEAHLHTGQLSLLAGDARRAIDDAQRARGLGLRRHGRSLEARARVQAGECDQGLALAAPLGTDVRDLDRLTEAWLMVVCGRDAEAESVLQELIQRPDQRAAALEALAGRELETRRNDAAARHFTELGKAGDRAGAQFGLATLAERGGDKERAASLFSAISQGRHVVEAQLRAYRLHVSTDGADIADRVLDDFVYANPDLRRELSSMRMLALADLGRTDEALSLGARVIKAFPDAEELVRAQAEVLARAGRSREAIVLLEGLLKRRPDDPSAQNALGYTLADANVDLQRAQKLLLAACAQAPDNAAYLDSLGWLRYRQGRYAPAQELLGRAYGLQPDPEIAVHFARALVETGRQEQARLVIEKALISHPQDAGLLRWRDEPQRGKP